jgi:hypothetical protein
VGRAGHFWVEAHKDQLYILTDYKAPNWKVMRADPKKPAMDGWKTIVAERTDASIDSDGIGILGGRLSVSYLKNATSQLEMFDLEGKKLHDVKLPGVGTVHGPLGRQDEDEAYFVYQSFTTPWEIHALSMKTAETKLYTKVTVPVDPSPYHRWSRCSIRRRTGPEGQHVHRAPEGPEEGREQPHSPLRIRRLPASPDERVHRVDLPLAGARRRLRGGRTCAAAANTARRGTRPG